MQSITFLDETAAGKVLQSWNVPVETDTITVQELIMLRVEEEIRRREELTTQHFFTKWNELTEAERLLNPQKFRQPKTDAPDPEACGYRALEAFKRNGFFILVGDKQVDRLDEIVTLQRENPISFVRLTPLVGG